MSANQELTLLHFGDLHVWRIGVDADFAFKRLLGLANLLLRRARRFPPALAAALIERLRGEHADYLLFTGDLTTTALRREFAVGRRLLGPLLERWDGRFIAIPGNHDRYTPRAAGGHLFETHFCPPHEALPFAVDLDARWTLVAFDTAVPRRLTSRGHVSPQSLEALRELLAAQRRRGRLLLAAAHYPLIYPGGGKGAWEHALPQRAGVLRALQENGVRVYLHGHAHHRWRLEHAGMVHLNCGSAAMDGRVPSRRPGYLKLRLDGDGLAGVEMHWLRPLGKEAPARPADWVAEELAPEKIA